MTPSLLYLAYGSNLLPRRLVARVPSARLAGTVKLTAWSLRFHKRGQDGSAKCNLLRTAAPTDIVHAAVYRMVPEERVLLDRFEGLGRGYSRQWLDMAPFGRMFYYAAMATHIDDRLLPFHWYKALVEAGARYHGFPEDYLNAIGALSSCGDPDAERQLRYQALLRAQEAESQSPGPPGNKRAADRVKTVDRRRLHR